MNNKILGLPFKLIIYIILFYLAPTNIYAADLTINMLDKLNDERMIFDPKIISIQSGDTVFWKAINRGHNVEFLKNGVPEGVEKFKSKIGKDTQFTFDVPGLYAYLCTPHKALGMIGFVIVDNNISNYDQVVRLKYLGKSKKIAQTLLDEIFQRYQ
jgi:pseudoazurin|tara:strand:- start:45 stop:512 length:468 start_codon:yes stop_codon:yes gene_type:complete